MSVTFYADSGYRGQTYTMNIANHSMNAVTVLPSLRDSVTSVTWNLPAGVVVTLMDDVNNDFASIHRSRTFDCIGSGSYDLKDIMNDCISAVYIGKYDSRLGYVTVYDDVNFSGNRTCLFLSQYPANTIYSIASWRQQDGISSIDWSNLADNAFIEFYDNADGSGRAYRDAFGWSGQRRIANLCDVLVNDCFSSFKWGFKTPMKEVIDKINIVSNGPMTVTDTYSDTFKGRAGDADVKHTLTISKDITQSSTCTVSNSSTFGWSVSATVSYTPPSALGGVGGSVTAGFSGSSTTTSETSTTTSSTIHIEQSTEVTAKANTNYNFVLSVLVGTVPETAFSTTATRWYDVPLSGSKPEIVGNNTWYKRTEKVSGTFSGGYATASTLKSS